MRPSGLTLLIFGWLFCAVQGLLPVDIHRGPPREMAMAKAMATATTTERLYKSTDDEVMHDERIMQILQRLKEMPAPTERGGYELNHEEWAKGLRDYPDEVYKENILKMNRIDEQGGWPVTRNEEIKTEVQRTEYPGTMAFWQKALEIMEKRVKSGYFIGPFKDGEPLPEWVLKGKEPLFNASFGKWETKHDGTEKLRILFDLSNGKRSFNDCIDDDEKKVVYITIIDVINRIIDCDLKWLWAIDALEAYYRVPIQQKFIPFLGVKLCGLIFFFTCLVMGMASACKLYTEFADVVCWIISNNHKELFKWREEKEYGINRVHDLLMHYIDDFIGGAQTEEMAWKQFNAVRAWWKRLNIPTQDKKCAPPAPAVRYLGFILNAALRTVAVPKDKLKKYTKGLRELKNIYEVSHQRNGKKRKLNLKATVRTLQRFTGQIRSIQIVYPYVVPYLRDMEGATANKAPGHHIRITDRMMKGLKVIEAALDDLKQEALPMAWIVHPRDYGDIEVYTDASTTIGVGGFINTENGKNYGMKWDEIPGWNLWRYKPDITYLELLGVVLAAKIWGRQWRGKSIKFWCDNYGACSIVMRKGACFRRRDLNDLMAALCEQATKMRFYFWIEHIEGKRNIIADALSRDIPLADLAKESEFHIPRKEKTKAKWEAKELLETWTENMEYVLSERGRKREDCRCDKTHDPTNKLCKRLNKEIEEANGPKRLNRKQRRALKFGTLI